MGKKIRFNHAGHWFVVLAVVCLWLAPHHVFGEDGSTLCAPLGLAPCNLATVKSVPDTPPTSPTHGALDTPGVAQNAVLGVNFANYPSNNPGSYAQAKAAGARYDRVTFSMAGAQSGWEGYDALVAAANSQNIEVLATLVEPAADACDASIGYSIWCVPKGLNLAWNDSGNPWSNWVYSAVQRYKTSIHSWEIWNEPNLAFWAGNEAQYALLLKRAYQAIKAADPTATVVFGGIFRGNNAGRTQGFWNAIVADPEAAANNYFFDVQGFHLYDGGHCSYTDEIEIVRSWMPAVLRGKPWWITESGVRVQDWPQQDFALPNEQADWIISNYSYALQKGMQRYYFWRMTDGGNTNEPWGLLKDDGTPRPAFTAYQVAAQYLPTSFAWSVRHFDESTPSQTGSRITFYGTPLGRVSVFYNIGPVPQTLTETAILSTGTWVYPNGSTAAAPSSNGRRVISMPGAVNYNSWSPPDCLVPSSPVILIERDTTPPVTTLATLPATSESIAIRLHWTTTDPLGAGDQGASGPWLYDGEFRVNGGAWQTLFSEETYTATAFLGVRGTNYTFRVRAIDRAGNAQAWASANIVATTIAANANGKFAFLPTIRR